MKWIPDGSTNNRRRNPGLSAVFLLLLFCSFLRVEADVGTYPSITSHHRLTVRYVVTETESGDRAKDLGTPSERAYVENQARRILAQSGIDVDFRSEQDTWVSRYAYEGATSDTGSRTTGDLNWIFDNIPSDYYQLEEGVVTVVFCKRTPGWALRGFYQTNGYAFIKWNGVTFFLGDGMLENNGNMDVVAAVLAHEIGHNFGLRHITSQFNLMNATIYEGFLESNQSEEILANRFDVGILAQIGLPDIRWINRGSSHYLLEHLRSTSTIELSSSTDLAVGAWLPEETALEHGIYKTGSKGYSDESALIFRTQETATQSEFGSPFIQAVEPPRNRNPFNREGVACGAFGTALTRKSR